MAAKKINIDKLIDSCFEISTSDQQSLDEMLKEHGHDPKKIETDGVQKIKQLLFKQMVQTKKSAMENLVAKAISMIQQAQHHSKDAVFALLRQKSPSLQFRNLEKLDDENLRQILTDTEILELIEKMEKGELQ
jgi:hypothetical protein